jgi:hypothetical protein
MPRSLTHGKALRGGRGGARGSRGRGKGGGGKKTVTPTSTTLYAPPLQLDESMQYRLLPLLRTLEEVQGGMNKGGEGGKGRSELSVESLVKKDRKKMVKAKVREPELCTHLSIVL